MDPPQALNLIMNFHLHQVVIVYFQVVCWSVYWWSWVFLYNIPKTKTWRIFHIAKCGHCGFRFVIYSQKQLLQHHAFYFLMNLIPSHQREGMTILELLIELLIKLVFCSPLQNPNFCSYLYFFIGMSNFIFAMNNSFPSISFPVSNGIRRRGGLDWCFCFCCHQVRYSFKRISFHIFQFPVENELIWYSIAFKNMKTKNWSLKFSLIPISDGGINK